MWQQPVERHEAGQPHVVRHFGQRPAYQVRPVLANGGGHHEDVEVGEGAHRGDDQFVQIVVGDGALGDDHHRPAG
ncbi:hypothetical protein OG990_20265 [Micromonospora sp. NBC_00858]|nr:hypothetical protein OG990_20265 [Micromonospora sp. NBC_00858]